MTNVMIIIVYDRAIDEEVIDGLEKLGLNKYTKWRDISGVGVHEPHFGDKTWPGLNNAVMIITEEEKKDGIIGMVRSLQGDFPFIALRAFTVPVLEMV